MIVGTAGHIDHGKTSLVRALTGVDTDRLKEEKARGITIELGFAYLPRPSGVTIGFIDVPGHERLVHTMLAGATGIDFALIVVAADDGVMPQTREHVAIIDLLGISHGLVALTKADLVAPERIDEVRAEIRRTLSDTSLADADIVPVSALTGHGVGELLAQLDAASAAVARRACDGRFRLAVDRVFTLSGMGTVVTGTALSGAVSVGDRVVVSPAGIEARVRSVHSQNRLTDRGAAGERCALALSGPAVSVEAIHRGDVVLDPTLHAPLKRLDAVVRLLSTERKSISAWMPVKLHHAACEVDARILALSDRGLRPGQSGYVQILFDRPIACATGDRIVLRDTSATRTIGGGTILDLHPPERQRRAPARLHELDVLARADWREALSRQLEVGRGFLDLDQWFRDRALSQAAAEEALRSLDLVLLQRQDSRIAMLSRTWTRYTAEAVARLTEFHHASPDHPGMGQERLRYALSPRLPAPAFGAAITLMVSDGLLAVDRSWVRLPTHVVELSEEEERIWANIRPLLSASARFRPPRVRDISKLQGIDEAFVRRLFRLSARRGDVDEIAKDHFFLADAVVEMASIARDLGRRSTTGEFTVIEFRDRLENGRKVAIQVLEFFDRQGLTMRRGDIRRINPHASDTFTRPEALKTSKPADGGESLPVGRPDFKSGEGRETALGRFDSCLLRQSTEGASR